MKVKEKTFYTLEFTDKEIDAIHTVFCAFDELIHATGDGKTPEDYKGPCIVLDLYDSIKEIKDYVDRQVSAYKTKLVKTNSDKLRQMSDEELAKWLNDNDSYFPIDDRTQYWLDFLKQDVSND